MSSPRQLFALLLTLVLAAASFTALELAAAEVALAAQGPCGDSDCPPPAPPGVGACGPNPCPQTTSTAGACGPNPCPPPAPATEEEVCGPSRCDPPGPVGEGPSPAATNSAALPAAPPAAGAATPPAPEASGAATDGPDGEGINQPSPADPEDSEAPSVQDAEEEGDSMPVAVSVVAVLAIAGAGLAVFLRRRS